MCVWGLDTVLITTTGWNVGTTKSEPCQRSAASKSGKGAFNLFFICFTQGGSPQRALKAKSSAVQPLAHITLTAVPAAK